MKKLYTKVLEKNIEIKKVCEVGVYLPEISNILDFIKDKIPTLLIEPYPPAIKAIKEYFVGYDNIDLKEVAIYDKKGTLSLSNAGASTFVSELEASPALVNDGYKVEKENTVTVPCDTFESVDTGDIELLSIDTEGCEWYVLETIKSRPKVISIETHGKFYINPKLDKIQKWIDENDYLIWFKDKSDTVYVKKDLITLSLSDKIKLQYMNLRLSLRRTKKVFYK